MKRLLVIIGIAILIGLPSQVGSINYRNKEMTLIQFNITIQPEIRRYLDQLESSFPPIKNDKADKIMGKIKELAWSALQDKLSQEIGMVIRPLNTFGSKIEYDAYGYPDVGISKAQKKGSSKYYMKIDMQIGPELYMSTTRISTKDKKDSISPHYSLQEGEIKPMVSITLTTFPTSGILPLDKFNGTTVAPSAWQVSPAILDGLVNENYKTDKSTLMSLIQEAVNELAISIATD